MHLQAKAIRAAIGVVTLAAVAMGGVVGCSSLSDTQGAGVVVTGGPSPSSSALPTSGSSLNQSEPSAPAADPESGGETVGTPEVPSPQSKLKWVEVNPYEAFDLDLVFLNHFESVGDGRVFVSTSGPGGARTLVTRNGTDWSEAPMPPDIVPEQIDIVGDRWIVGGHRLNPDGGELLGPPTSHVFFSDDQGATWSELDFSAEAPDGVSLVWVVAASGERMVVAAAYPSPDDPTDSASRGPVPDNVVFNRLGIFFSDGGLAELVADYPSWAASGYSTADGFHLSLLADMGTVRLFSPDGRQWSEAAEDYGAYGGFSFSTEDSGLIWTTDPAYDEYLVQRFPGVYGPASVATIPEGININHVLSFSVGPAGFAAVAQPVLPYISDRGATSSSAVESDPADRVAALLARPEPAVGWWTEGGTWTWQTSSDAFGLSDLTEEESPLTKVALAVGDDYVIARVVTYKKGDVRTYPSEYSDAPPGHDEPSTSWGYSSQTPRWFIATVD